MRAPRCLGSAATVCKVSAAAWKRMPRTTRLFWWAMAAISRGRVKTTWNVWFAPVSAYRDPHRGKALVCTNVFDL